MRAARAEWERIQRGVAEFDITLAKGRLEFYPEQPTTVRGFKPNIDAAPGYSPKWCTTSPIRVTPTAYNSKLSWKSYRNKSVWIKCGHWEENKRLCPNYMLHGAPQCLMQATWDSHFSPIALQHPSPTQIIPQIVGRYPMEPLHPLFQPPVISVYMLDVVRANHALALTITHDLMGHSLRFAETGIHPGAIATQHRIWRDKRCQNCHHRLGIHFLQLKIRMVASPVLNHHHRDVIRPCASGTAFAPTMAGGAKHVAL